MKTNRLRDAATSAATWARSTRRRTVLLITALGMVIAAAAVGSTVGLTAAPAGAGVTSFDQYAMIESSANGTCLDGDPNHVPVAGPVQSSLPVTEDNCGQPGYATGDGWDSQHWQIHTVVRNTDGITASWNQIENTDTRLCLDYQPPTGVVTVKCNPDQGDQQWQINASTDSSGHTVLSIANVDASPGCLDANSRGGEPYVNRNECYSGGAQDFFTADSEPVTDPHDIYS